MRLVIGTILLSLTIPAASQQPSTNTKKDTTVYNFLFFQPKFQNQFAFLGRNYGLDTSLGSLNVLYYTHSNVWFGFSGFSFADRDIPNLLAASLGIYKELSEKSDIHISYSQYYIPGSDVPESSRTQGYAQATLGLDWGLLYSTLQIHTLLNQQSDFLISTYHSRYFQFNNKLWKKILVSFEPKFSFTFGTNHFDYASDGVVIGPGGGGVTPPKQSIEDSGGSMKFLNWDFTVPLKFDGGRLSVETSWKYTSPVNISDTDPSTANHIFAVGIEYYIPIKRSKTIK